MYESGIAAILVLARRTEGRFGEDPASRASFPFRGFEEALADAGSSAFCAARTDSYVIPVRWERHTWSKTIEYRPK
jgi:hypothetical protein